MSMGKIKDRLGAIKSGVEGVSKRVGNYAAVAWLAMTLWATSCKKDEPIPRPDPRPIDKGENLAPDVSKVPEKFVFDLESHPTAKDIRIKLLEAIEDDNTSDDKLEITTDPDLYTLDLKKEGEYKIHGSVSDDGRTSKGKDWKVERSSFETTIKLVNTDEAPDVTNVPKEMIVDITKGWNDERFIAELKEHIADEDVKSLVITLWDKIEWDKAGEKVVEVTVTDKKGKKSICSVTLKIEDNRALVSKVEEIWDQKMELGKDLEPINLLWGIETLAGTDIVVDGIQVDNGAMQPLSKEEASNFIPEVPGEYRVKITLTNGEKTQTIERVFMVKSAEKQTIVNYPKGARKEISNFLNSGWDRATRVDGNYMKVIDRDDEYAGCDSREALFDINGYYECDGSYIIKSMVNKLHATNFKLYDKTYQKGTEQGYMRSSTNGVFKVATNGEKYYVKVEYDPSSSSQGTIACLSDAKPIEVPIVVDGVFQATVVDRARNKIGVEATGGVPPYKVSLDDGPFIDIEDFEFTIRTTKKHKIVVKDSSAPYTKDRINCPSIPNERIFTYMSIVIPNFFSPDNDGINEYWYPRYVEDSHELELFVYDRYGRELGRFSGPVKGWDGTYNGRPLPRGDYWYALYYKELNGERKKITGHFTLYRKDK